jgi:hypothetical protein
MANLAGHDLIDGRARKDIRARGFLDPYTRQKGSPGACMIAAAVGSRVGAQVFESGDDLHLVPDFFERLQGG